MDKPVHTNGSVYSRISSASHPETLRIHHVPAEFPDFVHFALYMH